MSLTQHRVSDKVAASFGISACRYTSMLWMSFDTGACSSKIAFKFIKKNLLDRRNKLEQREKPNAQ